MEAWDRAEPDIMSYRPRMVVCMTAERDSAMVLESTTGRGIAWHRR